MPIPRSVHVLSLIALLTILGSCASLPEEDIASGEPFPDAAVLFLGRDGDYRLAADPFDERGESGEGPRVQRLVSEPVGGRGIVSSSVASWSPSGAQVAVALQLEPQRNAARQVIALVTPDTGRMRIVWEEERLVPFVLGWSPDGRQLAVLATGSEPGLSLELVDLEGAGRGSRQQLARTAPIYFDWSSDSENLIVSNGGRVVSYGIDGSDARPLSPGGGNFRAPDAGPGGDGTLLVERRGSDQRIIEMDGAGRRLPHLSAPAGAAFSWSPVGRYMAALRFTGQGLLGVLSVVDTGSVARQISWTPVQDGGERRLVNSPAFAMEWAPDGDALLILAPDFGGDQSYAAIWQWAEPEPSGAWRLRELTRFQPDPAWIASRLPFFDQFTRVGSRIAPDSSAFVYGREEAGNGGRSEVLAYRLSDGSERRIGPGSLPTWRPGIR